MAGKLIERNHRCAPGALSAIPSGGAFRSRETPLGEREHEDNYGDQYDPIGGCVNRVIR